MSALLNAGLAFVLMLARKYNRCVAQALTTIEVDPDMTLSYLVLGVAYREQGQAVAANRRPLKKASPSVGCSPLKRLDCHVHGRVW